MSLPHSLFFSYIRRIGRPHPAQADACLVKIHNEDVSLRTSPLWDVPALPIQMKPIAAI